MKQYDTEQRKALLEFLQAHPDEKFSTRQIAQQLCEVNISQSSVYRNIGKLVESGIVERFIKQGEREIYYRFVGCENCKSHMHMSCIRCGRLYHMDQALSRDLLHAVRQTDEFEVDQKKTVFYGICKSCN